MAGSSSFRPNFFFFPFTIGYIQEPFLPRAFTSPTEQKKKKKQNTDDPCFSKARINGRQKYTKANDKTWHEHAHSARLHATRGRFRADQSASMIAVANKHGVGGGMCTSAGSRGIERSVTYKKTVVESFIAFMLPSILQGSNWAATSPVLKLWEVSRSFIINLTQFTLVGEAGKKVYREDVRARQRRDGGRRFPDGFFCSLSHFRNDIFRRPRPPPPFFSSPPLRAEDESRRVLSHRGRANPPR